MSGKIKKNILFSIFISIIIYLALAFYGNFDLVLSTLSSYQWQYFPIILLVIYLTLLLKFLKWQYYLRLVKVELKLSDSFHIFMATLTMSVTPGKIGELIKPYMVKELNDTPTSKTIPIVFAERVTEFAALLILVLFGIDLLNKGLLIPIIILVIIIVFVFIVFNRTVNLWIIKRVSNFKYLQKYIEPITTSFSYSRELLKPKPFILMFLLSIIIWLIECFSFYLILSNFNVSFSIMSSFFTYLFSVFIGAISFLPAGIGITDGSIAILLSNIGISREVSVSAALVIRIATLWFTLLVGILSMFILSKKLDRIIKE